MKRAARLSRGPHLLTQLTAIFNAVTEGVADGILSRKYAPLMKRDSWRFARLLAYIDRFYGFSAHAAGAVGNAEIHLASPSSAADGFEGERTNELLHDRRSRIVGESDMIRRMLPLGNPLRQAASRGELVGSL